MGIDLTPAQVESQIADAKLEVAEDFSFPFAFVCALVAYQRWDSLLLSAALFAVVWYGVLFKYRKSQREAERAALTIPQNH